MSLQYIRDYYNVPAKRGGTVELTATDGSTALLKITGSTGPHIRARFIEGPDVGVIVSLHPRWNLRFVDETTEEPK